MFGLTERDEELIKKAIESFQEIEQAFIFGSRAIGNYKKGSDVDVAISGVRVTGRTVSALNELLNEEYPLPYFFDILLFEEIKNDKLKEHIRTYGVNILG